MARDPLARSASHWSATFLYPQLKLLTRTAGQYTIEFYAALEDRVERTMLPLEVLGAGLQHSSTTSVNILRMGCDNFLQLDSLHHLELTRLCSIADRV